MKSVSGASEAWTVEIVSPTVDIVDVTPDPRHTSVSQITITFSEAVTGFDLADLQFTRGGSPVSLDLGQTLATSNNITWTLDGLAMLTAVGGYYVLTLIAAGAGIADLAGNSLAIGASDSFVTDVTAPTADIADVTPDPRTTAVDSVTITFSESMLGFNASDLRLTR